MVANMLKDIGKNDNIWWYNLIARHLNCANMKAGIMHGIHRIKVFEYLKNESTEILFYSLCIYNTLQTPCMRAHNLADVRLRHHYDHGKAFSLCIDLGELLARDRW